jgi:acetyltransferase
MVGSDDLAARYESAGFRVYTDSARAVTALGRALSEWPVLPAPSLSANLSKAYIAKAAASESAGKALLAALGIRVPAGFVGQTAGEMAQACKQWRFPVVAKVVSDQILHKTEIGGVRLNLNCPTDVESACADILSNVRSTLPGLAGVELLVEEQVAADAEVILGMKNDTCLGPMVMVGLGGVQAEVYKDVAFRMAPICETEALRMLDELKGRTIFDAFRARGALDRESVARAVSRLSILAAERSDVLQSIDVNPLLVTRDGAIAADCVIVLKD